MRTCARCGVNIDHRDKRSRHCSPRCRDRDYGGSAVGTVRRCAHCSEPFAPTKAVQVYCGKRCRDRAHLIRNRGEYNRRNAERRARVRGSVAGPPFTREQVFDRDGWICQLCLSPIDWRLSGRSPFAPALDHVIPLNAGGEHGFANTQAAHFGCNASKQDRTDVVLLPVPRR